MTINLTLPLIPLSGYQAPNIDPVTYSVYQLIAGGDAFINPCQTNSTNLIASINSTISYLNGSPTNFTGPGEPDDVIAGLNSLKNTLDDFIDFTNLQSGVTIPDSNTITPSLAHLINLGISITTIDHKINGITDTPAQLMVGLFGSLFIGPRLISEINDYVMTIQSMGISVTATEVTTKLTEYGNGLVQSQSNDIAAYNQALTTLQRFSFAGGIKSFSNDPCGKYILQKLIGSQALLDTLP